jgi:hypothetical protein
MASRWRNLSAYHKTGLAACTSWLNTTDLRLPASLGKSGMLAVNRKKATDKSSGKTFFDVKRVAAPTFISILLLRKHLPGHAGVVDGHELITPPARNVE